MELCLPYIAELCGLDSVAYIDGRLSRKNASWEARSLCVGRRFAYKVYRANRLRDILTNDAIAWNIPSKLYKELTDAEN